MQIIKTGSLPSEKVLRGTCTNCGTVIEAPKGECSYGERYNETEYYYYACPLAGCHTKICMTPDAFYNDHY